MKTIILIDDHPIVRLGIRSLIESQDGLSVCAEAGSREEAVHLLEIECPDLAIVDLILGVDDGLEFVKELKILCPDLHILVMTMQDESIYAERVIRAGADGFITKQDATDYLLEAVQTVLEGNIYLSRQSSARVLGRVLRDDKMPTTNPISQLSDRELHVFQMIGTGLATREIAKSLSLSPKTIETYRENIKRKLELKDAAALRTAADKWVQMGVF